MQYFSLALCCLSLLSAGVAEGQGRESDDHKLKDLGEIALPWNVLLKHFYEIRTKAEATENAVEPPLRIGAFNVQTLTNRKMLRTEIMSTVEKVILRYDLMLLTELLVTDFEHVSRLITILNRLSPAGEKYKVTISASHPQTKETCAFFYKPSKLSVIKAETYRDPKGNFFRKPFLVQFQAKTLRDMTQFVALGLHVKPNKAASEMDALASVYDFIREEYGIADVLMMGDFNADCSYVKGRQWQNISLWTRPEFTWPIKHNMDTTTSHSSCALDRFVFAGKNMDNGVIMSSAGVFDFQEAYGLTFEETKQVSDHFPIELQIRGKASEKAEKHLTTDICVTVEDSRSRIASMYEDKIRKNAKSAGFDLTTTAEGLTILESESHDVEEMLETLEKLHSSVQDAVTSEQIQTLKYKIGHGSLRDDSSHADLPKKVYRITVIIYDRKNVLFACRKTTLN